MASMRCGFCGKTLQYFEQIAYTFRNKGELRAGLMIEGKVDADDAESKYHINCYRQLREQYPSMPALPEPG